VHAGVFEITASDCAVGLELAAGRACSITVAFRAAGPASGLRSANLDLGHDWVGGGTALALIGHWVSVR
jgi:hypothetical protein